MPNRPKKANKGRKRKRLAISGRKPAHSQRLDAATQDALPKWQHYEEALKDIEVAVIVDPVWAAQRLVEFADRDRRRFARYARLRFGVEVRSTESDARAFVTRILGDRLQIVGWGGYKPVAALSVTQPERRPRNPWEEALLVDLLTSYAIADFAERAMIEVGWDVKEAGYDVEDMAWVMSQVFLSVYRKRFVFSGVSMEQESGLHPMLRQVSSALLAGWVGSKISLKRHKRLSAALAERGERSFDALLQELPAATFVEWYTARREDSLKGLVSGVTRSLEKLGREATIKPKVRDMPPEGARGTPAEPAAVGEDEDLVKFEVEETARQQLDTLEQVAGLSQQQTAVWQRLRRGMEIAEIAAELGISENQVSVQKHNTMQKLIEARKVAGF